MKLPARFIPTISLSILIALNLALGFGVMLPLAVSFKRHTAEIAARRAELEARRAAPARAGGARASRIAEIAALRTLAVEEESELPFITALEDIAAQKGVTIDLRLVPPPAGAGATGYERLLGIEMTLKGEPRRVGKFVQALEARDTVLIVKTFSVTAVADSPGTVSAQLSAAAAWPEKPKNSELDEL